MARRGPSEDVLRLVAAALPRILDEAGTDGLLALAVVGSCARGEETWLDGELLSDVDVAAVTKAVADPWAVRRFERVGRTIGHGLTIGCFPLYSLRRYRTLEFYGAKRDGWVCWGDESIFDRVRIDGPEDVPPWEAPRLVLNRAMDLLRSDLGLLDPGYAIVKMYLALGEAALILEGRYDPSYRRQRHLIESREAVLGSRELRAWFLTSAGLKLEGADPKPFRGEREAHRARILDGMTRLFSMYLGRDVGALDGLRGLSNLHRTAPHRALYLARNASRPARWGRAITSDPVFWFWKVAIEALIGKSGRSVPELVELLADFDRTHQPLPR